MPPHENVHFPLIADFTASLPAQKPPRVTGEEGRKTSLIIDGAYRSQADGAWVDLEGR